MIIIESQSRRETLYHIPARHVDLLTGTEEISTEKKCFQKLFYNIKQKFKTSRGLTFEASNLRPLCLK